MLSLRNQFIFAPIKTGYGDGSGNITERHIVFYTARSRYLGAVTIEPPYMDKGLREIPAQVGIDDNSKIEGLRKLTDVIHSFDTKAIIHLNHPGRMANPRIPGNYFLSSTDRPCEKGGANPRCMNREDMERVIIQFVESAERARRAGFDIIELQFGHGYLLAQFISPVVNDRTDEYGVTFENRVRFPLEVFRMVKKAVDLPIIVRLSGDEMIPGGITLDEMIVLSKLLEKEGADAIHISAGTVCSSPPWFFQHMFIPKGKTWEMAKTIKKEVGIPVIFVGRVNSPEDIERLKNDYNADYIAIGRELIADPDFIGKYLGEVNERIRPCLACSEGCLGSLKAGEGLQCVVNPLAGKDDLYTFDKTKAPKRFAIVGGGLSGMEAAITLKKRGHSVVIYESNKLGGQFNLAFLPPHKETLRRIIDYYTEEINSLAIPVIYKEAKEPDLLEGKYDGVVLATGSKPAIPPIEGLKEYYWAEVLEDENLFEGSKALVIGGGLIGIEIANKLLARGNKVIIVEMLEGVARGMEMIEKSLTMEKFKTEDINIFLNSYVSKIEGSKVYIRGEQNKILQNIDHIILATGMKSYNPLEEKLKGKIPVYVIGDAKRVGKAKDAIRSGFETAKEL